MTPTIVNYPHVEWCELVQWLTDEMNKSGEYSTDFYYVEICLNAYIADSDGWVEDASCFKVRYPARYYNNTTNAISPYIKKFFKTFIDSPLSWFYVDND